LRRIALFARLWHESGWYGDPKSSEKFEHLLILGICAAWRCGHFLSRANIHNRGANPVDKHREIWQARYQYRPLSRVCSLGDRM